MLSETPTKTPTGPSEGQFPIIHDQTEQSYLLGIIITDQNFELEANNLLTVYAHTPILQNLGDNHKAIEEEDIKY